MQDARRCISMSGAKVMDRAQGGDVRLPPIRQITPPRRPLAAHKQPSLRFERRRSSGGGAVDPAVSPEEWQTRDATRRSLRQELALLDRVVDVFTTVKRGGSYEHERAPYPRCSIRASCGHGQEQQRATGGDTDTRAERQLHSCNGRLAEPRAARNSAAHDGVAPEAAAPFELAAAAAEQPNIAEMAEAEAHSAHAETAHDHAAPEAAGPFELGEAPVEPPHIAETRDVAAKQAQLTAYLSQRRASHRITFVMTQSDKSAGNAEAADSPTAPCSADAAAAAAAAASATSEPQSASDGAAALGRAGSGKLKKRGRVRRMVVCAAVSIALVGAKVAQRKR